jgi:diguanylate cyclase (GGDEF)-like protein
VALVQFRYLHTRIVAAFVSLLLLVEGTGFFLINGELTSATRKKMESDLRDSEQTLNYVRLSNINSLTQAASILSSDFGFRQAAATRDGGTVLSALQNQEERGGTELALFADTSGQIVASTFESAPAGQAFPFPSLIEAAARNRRASGIVLLDGRLYQLIVVPVLAPVSIGWLVRGTAIDDRFAKTLKHLENAMEISFLARSNTDPTRWQLIASTLSEGERAGLVTSFAKHANQPPDGSPLILGTGDDDYLSTISRADGSNPDIVAVLQSSFKRANEPLHELQLLLLLLALSSLGATALAGLVIGRGITRPVTQLSQIARRLEQGDYSEALHLDRRDEIGALSSAFNHMQAAIAKREARIRDLAFVDGMTRLPNRTAFLESLERAIREAQLHGNSATVLIMDIDRFKEVNDTLGHPMGDLLLEEVGARLAVVAAAAGLTAARLGGDEFALLIPSGSISNGMALAAEVARALNRPVLLDNLELVATVSVGMAEFPLHANDMNLLLQHAEVAMYSAKQSKSGPAVYDPRTHLQSEERLALMTDLHQAVKRNQLLLHYQPKIDIATGRIGEVEALVRWNHPVRGMIPPNQFIPLAEYTGQIRGITPWVIDAALRQAGAWRRRGLDLRVAVNVSARDLSDPGLPQMISSLVRAHQAEPDWLMLEITESGIMADPAGAQQVIETLHGMGFDLAIDDFGTGYSSLSYLKRLPVSELKIDKSFVLQMASDSNDCTIVRSTIRLAQDMGLRVTAEGVEDQVTYQMLTEFKCDAAQGFFMARPQPAAQLEAWLEQAPWQPVRLRAA